MMKITLLKIKEHIEKNLKEKYSLMEMKFRNAYEENDELLDIVFNEYHSNQKDLAENLSNELFKYMIILTNLEKILIMEILIKKLKIIF